MRKKHENRKKLLNDLDELRNNSRSLFQKADKTLDRDDPVLEKLYQMLRTIDQGCSEIDSVIEKGQKLEEF